MYFTGVRNLGWLTASFFFSMVYFVIVMTNKLMLGLAQRDYAVSVAENRTKSGGNFDNALLQFLQHAIQYMLAPVGLFVVMAVILGLSLNSASNVQYGFKVGMIVFLVDAFYAYFPILYTTTWLLSRPDWIIEDKLLQFVNFFGIPVHFTLLTVYWCYVGGTMNGKGDF